MAKKIKGPSDLEKYIPGYDPIEGQLDFNSTEHACFWLPLDKRFPIRTGANSAKKIVIHATTAHSYYGAELYKKSTVAHSQSKKKNPELREWRHGSQWFQGNYRRAAGHYCVFIDGEICQHAPETSKIWHAGGAPKGFTNNNSIGIEHHYAFKSGKVLPTKEMYQASANLVKDICKRRNIPIDKDHITGHKPNPGDPGVYWDWDYYWSLLREDVAPVEPKTEKQLEKAKAKAPATPTEEKNRYNNAKSQTKPKSPSVEKEEKQKDKKEKDIVPLTDDEIKASAIGFYLPQLIENRVKNDNDSIIHLETDNSTSYIQNLLFGKGTDQQSDFSTLSNLDLSSLVPFVELYSIKRGANASQKHDLYPFDDYTSQTKLDLMFADKTGRGGNVGIESVDWKTVATNPSNINQIMISVKIRIQDIQDIETPRNGVSLLDFLYPGGSSNNQEFNTKSFNVKLKVGWLYKRQQNNSDFKDLDKKIGEKLLSDSILATLYKHSFEFDTNGSVLLNLEYYGMLETEISNPYEYDVLEKLNPKIYGEKNRKKAAEFIWNAMNGNWNNSTFDLIMQDPDKFASIGVYAKQEPPGDSTTQVKTNYIYFGANGKQKIGTSKYNIQTGKWEQTLTDQSTYTKTAASFDSSFEDYIEKLVEETEQDLEASFLDGIANLLQTLAEENRIHYLTIDKEQTELLKNISEISRTDEILTSEQYGQLKEKIAKVRMAKSSDLVGFGQRISELLNTEELSTAEEVLDGIKGGVNYLSKGLYGAFGSELSDKDVLALNVRGSALERSGNKITLNSKEFEKNLLTSIRKVGNLYVSYVYFGDILNYYMKLFYDDRDALQNRDLRLVLGSFSYRDIGDITSDASAKGKSSARTSKVLKDKEGKSFVKVSTLKKYANLSDLPISIESLLNWYNTNVLDSGIERMSFHKFMNSLFRNVVPANFGNSILNYGPKRSFIPGFNYITTSKDEENEKELRKSAKNRQPGKAKYIINMEEAGGKYKTSPFRRLRNKAEIKDITKKTVPVTNYMFITSLSERDKNLKSSYSKDLEKGIYHFYVGEDKGLVREIKFSREDNPKLDAANLVKANKNNTDNQIIRQIYNCNISLFGNTVFYPGQLIFVNPTYPGARLKNKTLFKIGLGGYFQILKITNFIEPGRFETKLETKWLNDGQGFEGVEGFLKIEPPKATSGRPNPSGPGIIGVKVQ